MSFVLVCGSMLAHAQTNVPSGGRSVGLFLPMLQLRREQPELSISKPTAAIPTSATAVVAAEALMLSPALERSINYISAGWSKYYGTPDEGGFYHWMKAKAFPEPEVIQIGHVALTGSLVTALKARNPAALLNPMVLSVSY
jgi:hypothetical protein